MAPDASTQERIYRAIKRELFAIPTSPGQRLDIQALGDRHSASTTPVREAMHRLIGERLLEHHPDGGIRIVLLDDAELKDLYQWSEHLSLLTLRLIDSSSLRRVIERAGGRRAALNESDGDIAAPLFESMGVATGNREIVEQIVSVNERLFFVRKIESSILPDSDRELRKILRNGRLDLIRITRLRVMSYHKRRILRVSAISERLRHVDW